MNFHDQVFQLLVGRFQFHERHDDPGQERPFDDGRLAADQDRGALFLSLPQGLRHQVDAVHAAGAVLVVDLQLFPSQLHAPGRAEIADLFLDIEAGCGISCDFLLVDPDIPFPGADHGQVGPGDGGDAVVGAGGNLDLELVREHGPMDLVLEGHGQVVADIEAVDAGPFAAPRPHAGAGCAQR